MATSPQSSKTQQEFSSAAATGKKKRIKPLSTRAKVILAGLVISVFAGGYLYSVYSFVPPQGNALYGICRVFIERQLQYPTTMKVIEFGQRIPESENPQNPKRITNSITFSSTDGFGQRTLNTVDCDFRYDEKLVNTPWQGFVLERTAVNGRSNHGWSDVFYPPDRKSPRAPDDNSELLEEFNKTIPIILKYPPDLTLPKFRLSRMTVEQLKDVE